MKILMLCSRFHCSRDIIEDDFGRSMQLGKALSTLGNQVHLFSADYRNLESLSIRKNNFRIRSHPFSVMQSFSFVYTLGRYIQKNKFDIIIATSIPLWGVIAYVYSIIFRIRFVYDLSDNWDTLISGIPAGKLLKPFNSHVIKHADMVSCVSNTLKARTERMRKGRTTYLPNGVDLNMFKSIDREKCRDRLGLPSNREIIAYTGSMYSNRGISILMDAFQIVREEYPDSILLLVGNLANNVNITSEGVVRMELKHRDVVYAINAADVVVLPNPVNEFTRYCFPYKMLEYMACNTPIVATNVGAVGELLKNYGGCLCEPDNSMNLAEKIRDKLKNIEDVDYRKDLERYSWIRIGKKLNEIIECYVHPV